MHPGYRYGRIGDFCAAPRTIYYLRGEAAEGYHIGLLERFDRHIMMIPDSEDEGTYFLIHDLLESCNAHTYEWLLHSANPAIIGEKQTYTIQENGRVLKTQLLKPKGLKANNGGSYNNVHKLALAPKSPQMNQDFLVVMTFFAVDAFEPAVALVDAGKAVRIDGMSWQDTITVGEIGGDILSDGAYSMVRQSSGEILRWATVGSTNVKYEDQLLLVSNSACFAAATFYQGRCFIVLEVKIESEVKIFSISQPNICFLNGQLITVEYAVSDRLGRHELIIN